MPASIPEGITRESIQRAAASLDRGIEHPFGPPTEYSAIVGGKHYPPKALIGLGAGYALGRSLGPADFSGGEAPGQANWYLRQLGFEVVSLRGAVGEDWTDDEIAAAIDVYFDMLAREIRAEKYVKAPLLRALAARTHGRSVKSCEYKLQNISAVLIEMGLTRLDGFAPAANFQAKLGAQVEQFLQQNPQVLIALEAGLETVPPVSAAITIPVRSEIEVGPPDPPEPVAPNAKRKRPLQLVDAAARDGRNTALGKSGEEFVVAMERTTLTKLGRSDLAARVRWVAQLDGDGLGYDVLSYDATTGEEIWIEVKTTNRAKEATFFVTANEVSVSESSPHRYRLYRVFAFNTAPRLYVLTGNLAAALNLQPISFRAAVKSSPSPLA